MLSIVTRYDLGIMYYLSKVLLGILPWVPWSPRCSKNLVRSCQDIQDVSKRVNMGSEMRTTENRCTRFFMGFFE